MSYYDFEKPMSVKDRRVFLAKKLLEMEKINPSIQPVRAISARKKLGESYWAQAWCQHIESYADYDYRVDRGRSYLRQGAILDLVVNGSTVESKVYGVELYSVEIIFQPLNENISQLMKKKFEDDFLSSLDIVSGNFSESLKEFLKDQDGLFPNPNELNYTCNCLDDADLCKHIAATLYGIGLRFDVDPSLFFTLRGLNPLSLVNSCTHQTNKDCVTASNSQNDASLFDIDIL
ncbi:MAG: SWIM zinc finger family protein [Oligoflexales bacterium]